MVLTMAAIILSLNMDNGQVRDLDSLPMVTSWYGRELQGSMMANGQRFKAEDPTIAANKDLPIGTKLELTNPDNGHQLVVEVKDRGPYVRGRNLDISEAAAKRLGIKEEGIKALTAKIVRQ
jgi:rare lipoprotein A